MIGIKVIFSIPGDGERPLTLSFESRIPLNVREEPIPTILTLSLGPTEVSESGSRYGSKIGTSLGGGDGDGSMTGEVSEPVSRYTGGGDGDGLTTGAVGVCDWDMTRGRPRRNEVRMSCLEGRPSGVCRSSHLAGKLPELVGVVSTS